MQGPWELSLVSGQSVLIPNATLLSNPAGKLTLTETSKIEVTLEVAMPEDGSQPYGVFDTEAIPDEWGQYKLPPADALLDSGVSVPLKRWKLPWLKRPVEVRVTMKRPRLWGQILLAREYLKMGVAPGWQAKDKVEELAFVAEHGKAVSRLLAYTVCRGYVSRHVGIGVTAWVLRNFVEWRYLTAMFQTFERLMGTKDFMRIISSTARANPMTPRLSQARKGS